MSEKRPITIDDLYKIVYVEDPQVSPDGRYIAFVKVTVDRLENGYQRNIWLAPTDGGEPFQITRSNKDSTPRWSPDGKTLAFVSMRSERPQIYLLPLIEMGGEARALTNAQTGATSPQWSPDGEYIAYLSGVNAEERAKEDAGETPEPPKDKLEMEQRIARKMHDETERWDPRLVERIPYRAGTAYLDDRYQQIYIVRTAEGLEGDEAKPRRLTSEDTHHTPPQWSPDGTYIYTSRAKDPEADEPFRHSRIWRVRVEDGAGEFVLDSEAPISDMMPRISQDGRYVAFARVQLPLDSLTKVMALPLDGGEPLALNAEIDRSPAGYDWMSDGKLALNVMNYGDTVLYHSNPANGDYEQRFTDRMVMEDFDMAADGGVAFVGSTPENPCELYWLPSGADKPQQLTHFNQPLLDEIYVQPVQEVRYESPNGEVQGWYILPVGYEEGQKYPLALNIHGGPHGMWGPSTRTMWHEWQVHAASGYVVFYCNPRGSTGYGEAFIQALHADWGDVAFKDIMAGVDAMLERFDFVDEARMAVTGGSYGGYMTAWVVGHTERFKAAVTQRGVYNLVAFYGVTDVPILISDSFDTEPWEDPQKLWEHSPLAYAHNITTPLLIIHAENDFRVPISEAEQLFAIVRRTGKAPVKFLRYPRDGHELSRSGEPKHRASRLSEMVAWFDQYCKTGEEA